MKTLEIRPTHGHIYWLSAKSFKISEHVNTLECNTGKERIYYLEEEWISVEELGGEIRYNAAQGHAGENRKDLEVYQVSHGPVYSYIINVDGNRLDTCIEDLPVLKAAESDSEAQKILYRSFYGVLSVAPDFAKEVAEKGQHLGDPVLGLLVRAAREVEINLELERSLSKDRLRLSERIKKRLPPRDGNGKYINPNVLIPTDRLHAYMEEVEELEKRIARHKITL